MDSVSQLLISENQKVVNMSLYRGGQMYPCAGQVHRELCTKLKKQFFMQVTMWNLQVGTIANWFGRKALFPEEGNSLCWWIRLVKSNFS